MQHIPMSRGRRARRGFTMIELLVALVLLGLVSTALYRVLVNNQRLYMAQTQRIDLSQNIRAAGSILPAEFRELDAADGDIAAMSATSISIRAMRWLSFVCIAPGLGGGNNGIQMNIRGGQPGTPMFFGSRAPNTGTDSLLVYLDGDQTTRADDYYVRARFVSQSGGVGQNCPAAGVVPPQTGIQVVFDGSFLPGTNKAGAIPVGSPVRGFERVVYSLFRPAGDTSYYIGFQPAGQSPQPLIGHVLTNGLTFSYYDVNGNVTAVPAQVARIDITVRARTAAAVRRGGQAARATMIDSVVTSVALRNNRRF